MGKRSFLLILLCMLVVGAGGAQSNEFIDRLLTEEELRFGSAVYLVTAASSAHYGAGKYNIAAALRRARPRMPSVTDTPLTLGQYAHLLQSFFDLPEGLWYRVVQSPRFAARDLTHAGIIQGRAYPRMKLSGERALRILGRALAYLDGQL